MSLRVRVVIPARNEEQRLGALLDSVARGIAFSDRQPQRHWTWQVSVVLDHCVDRTRQVAEARGVSVLQCPAPYGKVEALRFGLAEPADVFVCIDADVVLGRRTLFDLVARLVREPHVLASCPPLRPEPVRGRASPLSWALFRYNRARGFSSERLWLSGRCYALRQASFPTPSELARRAAELPRNLQTSALSGPLLADDIWLSRWLLAQRRDAIAHVETDPVWFGAPSSLRGMSRTYRRLRRELRRVDLLFPELPGPGRDRRADAELGPSDKLALTIFRTALAVCRAHAWSEEMLQRCFAYQPDPWPVVVESKR